MLVSGKVKTTKIFQLSCLDCFFCWPVGFPLGHAIDGLGNHVHVVCSGFASKNCFCRWVKTVPTSHRLISTFVQHTPAQTKCGRPYDLQMSDFFSMSVFWSGPISAMKAAKSVWLCTSYRAKSTSVALFKYANVCGPSHVSNDWPPTVVTQPSKIGFSCGCG